MSDLRILVSCGTGIATSTLAADKLKRLLKSRGLSVTTASCKAAEVAGKVSTFRPHAIVSTTQVAVKVPVKVFNGLPLISGVGADQLADEIAAYLKTLSAS
ncbi:PTS sugar transporter subunit IIB [Thermogemmatispora onikobensis]|uniref:PTS sugar transporter subunit IIB n=1 Tax=Thermogemmatispora onikobensis TaxID=732234 RepID=UPI000853855F|nr:PTS sugar transporter subunit IIB [Thermogemmatispora onikobensis]